MGEAAAQAQRLLTLLQYGDSQFPAGSFAYSAGLEGLLADGMTAPDSLPQVMAGMLHCRWAPFDRVAVRLAWQADGADERLLALDAQVEACLLAAAERTGSRRAGAALLMTHVRLGTAGAARLRAQVEAGSLGGHRAVVEGAMWRALGLSELEAAALSGYAFVNGLCAACVRLGRLGALAHQQIIAALAPDIARLAARELPVPPVLRAFNPLAEIAIMRHRARERTLFAT